MSSQQYLSEDSTNTFSSFNITPSRRKIRETFFGKIRAFSTITTSEWLYLAISLLGLIAALGMTIERLVELPTGTTDFTFALYFLLTIVFCLYYVIHAVLTERPDELFIFVVCNIIAAIYCIVNFVVGLRTTLKLARLVLVCLMSVVLVPSGLHQTYKYWTSNYFIFYMVGGSTELHRACKMYSFCSTLLKFDLQLQLTMLILVRGSTGESINQTEEIILAVGMAITLVFFILGFVGLCLENRIVMVIFFILGLWEPGYVTYKFVYVHTHHTWVTTYWSNIICGVIAILVWATLMICTGYFTKYYFYKGLKEKKFGQVQTGVTQQSTSASLPAEESANPSTQATEQPAAEYEIRSPLHRYFPQTDFQQVI